MNIKKHHQGVKNDKIYLKNGKKVRRRDRNLRSWKSIKWRHIKSLPTLFQSQLQSAQKILKSLDFWHLRNSIISPITFTFTETFNVFIMTLPISLLWGLLLLFMLERRNFQGLTTLQINFKIFRNSNLTVYENLNVSLHALWKKSVLKVT